MKEEGSLKTLDEQIRVRMARTGESYEDAATAIGHYNVERVRVAVALRVWARSYSDEVKRAAEEWALKVERGDHVQ